ncbi:MAG: hypothetical protein AB1690_12435 [Candidatus Zixiibacteriota bacterium]
MFIGHIAVGLASKKISPRLSLGTLLLSVQFIDLLWPVMLILGLEKVEIVPGITAFTPLDFKSYPITHSLLMVVIWGLAFGFVYFLFRRHLLNALLLGFGVVSHWLLDLLTHRPDLPLAPGVPTVVGLGVWNFFWLSFVLESLLYVIGISLYLTVSRPKDRTGTYSFWSLILFLGAIFIANAFGPPPPNVNAIAYAGLALWLLPLWGYWIERHREPRRNW